MQTEQSDWLGARSALGHCIACADVFTEMLDGDVLDALVFSSLVSAMADPDTGVWHTSRASRGVSAWSISRDVGAPYETVRRRLARLMDRGFCQRTEEGYSVGDEIAPESALAIALRRIGSRTFEVHRGGITPPRVDDGDLLISLAMLGLRHFLRALPMAADTVGLEYSTALLFMRIYSANIEGLELQESLAMMTDPWPDELRAGVTCYRMASLSGVPYETVRRQAHRLQQSGHCAVDAEGHLFIPSQVISSPTILAAAAKARALSQDLAGRIDRRIRGTNFEAAHRP